MTESSKLHNTPILISTPVTIQKPLALHPYNPPQTKEVVIPPIVRVPSDFELQSISTMASSRSLYSLKSHYSSVGAREMEAGFSSTLKHRISSFACFMLIFLSCVSTSLLTVGYVSCLSVLPFFLEAF
ncbi:hypothetical protein BLNAU_19281 [Blattamonas nauphoetae]|uniref:Transmembrane protein n=1 Tax=Blattamonas nauphoetae TaxID=2049346 RepID=A0ABQ9X2J4_9EUKA|nr:hypothetical protein BLNAU_19281 [Blattamonas nauphoetae]